METFPFKVKYTESYASKNKILYPKRTGMAIGQSRDKVCYRVIWDNTSKNSIVAVAKTFLEKVIE